MVIKVPVDPRSDLPVRIAKAVSETLGIKINPSQFYTHDDSPLGVWHSSRRFDYEHEEENRYLFHNRRVTCFNLLQDPSGTATAAIPLQVKFHEEKNMRLFARCAIHEVHESPTHNFEGQSTPVFDPTDSDWKKKIGLELTLNTTSPILARTLPNGNFIMFSESVGQASKFEPGIVQYDSREHGTNLVKFAADYINQNHTPPTSKLTLG